MKRSLCIPLISIVAASQTLVAEPNYEKELEQLNQQHEKALSAATEPINRLYQSALRNLFRVSKSSEVAASAGSAANVAPQGPAELSAFLAGTVWEITNEKPDGKALYTLTFLKNGTFLHSDGRTGVWSALSPRDLKLWDWDPAVLNDDLTQFRALGTGVVYFGRLKK